MITRRRFLRGVAGGATVTAALPFLDLFLDDHGEALADGGALPVRFGTWFWGCGMNPDRWVPPTDGLNYTLSPELAPIEPVRRHLNVLSGFDAKLGGAANIPHHTGVVATLCGVASGIDHEYLAPTLDTTIAAALGKQTRFRSLEVSADGVRAHTYSRFSTSVINQSEVSPIALYQRLFGPDFADPNGDPAPPDPRIQLRRSVLSAVMDDTRRLEAELGAHDKRRLDQYLTSVRELEQRLGFLLGGTPPLEACTKPEEPGRERLGADLATADQNHALLTELLTMALACDQTRVINVLFSSGLSGLRVAGTNSTHHELTHNEVIDSELGYQPTVLPFLMASMEAWSGFVQRLAAVREGDGTLLDNCLVMAHSETSFAQAHDIRGLPIMTAGSAGGALKTGLHVRGNGDAVTRVGFTVQQALGLPVSSWGSGEMLVSAPIGEILA